MECEKEKETDESFRNRLADALCYYIEGKTRDHADAVFHLMLIPYRITRRDDEHYIVTYDFRFDRINLEIDEGIVTKADVG